MKQISISLIFFLFCIGCKSNTDKLRSEFFSVAKDATIAQYRNKEKIINFSIDTIYPITQKDLILTSRRHYMNLVDTKLKLLELEMKEAKLTLEMNHLTHSKHSSLDNIMLDDLSTHKAELDSFNALLDSCTSNYKRVDSVNYKYFLAVCSFDGTDKIGNPEKHYFMTVFNESKKVVYPWTP